MLSATCSFGIRKATSQSLRLRARSPSSRAEQNAGMRSHVSIRPAQTVWRRLSTQETTPTNHKLLCVEYTQETTQKKFQDFDSGFVSFSIFNSICPTKRPASPPPPMRTTNSRKPKPGCGQRQPARNLASRSAKEWCTKKREAIPVFTKQKIHINRSTRPRHILLRCQKGCSRRMDPTSLS